MQNHKGRRRQSGLSTRAIDSICPSWTLRWAHPSVQLVHPDIEREQLLDLYLEVYKLYRLPGSPPGELAILEGISSILSHPSSEEKDTPNLQRGPPFALACTFPPENEKTR